MSEQELFDMRCAELPKVQGFYLAGWMRPVTGLHVGYVPNGMPPIMANEVCFEVTNETNQNTDD